MPPEVAERQFYAWVLRFPKRSILGKRHDGAMLVGWRWLKDYPPRLSVPMFNTRKEALEAAKNSQITAIPLRVNVDLWWIDETKR